MTFVLCSDPTLQLLALESLADLMHQTPAGKGSVYYYESFLWLNLRCFLCVTVLYGMHALVYIYIYTGYIYNI